MARFYDTVSDTDLKRVEGMLKKRGIVYSLQILDNNSTKMKEIQVSEEDMADAEAMLYGNFNPNN